jgi:hypothetical protein
MTLVPAKPETPLPGDLKRFLDAKLDTPYGLKTADVRYLLTTPVHKLQRTILRPGNVKLSRHILTFGLPAILSCPGATELCSALCYACTYNYKLANVIVPRMENFVLACRPDFDEILRRELPLHRQKVIRPHDSGDLFNAAYAAAWYRVMRDTAALGYRYFIFSRSWRVAEVCEVLGQMSRLRNVRLWYSVDQQTGWPAYLPQRVRLAWMQTTEADLPPRPVDLVFRDYAIRRTRAKRVRGALVCPYENGFSRRLEDGGKFYNCWVCGLCWQDLDGPHDPRAHHDERVLGTGRIPLKLVPLVV